MKESATNQHSMLSQRRNRFFSLMCLGAGLYTTLACVFAAGVVLTAEWLEWLPLLPDRWDKWEFDQQMALFTAIGVGMVLLVIVTYFLSYDIFRSRRPWVRLFLTFLPLVAYPVTIFVAYTGDFLAWTSSISAAVILPVFLIGAEQMLGFGIGALGGALMKQSMGGLTAFLLRWGLYMYPRNLRIRRDYGLILLSRGQLEPAKALLEPLFESGMREGRIARALFELSMAEENWEQALDRLQPLRKEKPDDRTLLLTHLDLLLKIENFEAARDFLEALPATACSEETWKITAQVHRKLGNLEGALKAIEPLVEDLRYDETLSCYRELLEEFPGEISLYRTLAEQAATRRRTPEEAEWLEYLVEGEPNDWSARRRLVEIYGEAKRPMMEAKHLEPLIKKTLKPEADDLIRYSQILADDNRHTEGLALLEQHQSTFANDARFPLQIARHCLKLEALSQARSNAQKALQLIEAQAIEGDDLARHPDAQAARTLLRQVDTALLRRELELARKAAAAEPGNMNHRMRFIELLAVNDKIDSCVDELDRIVTEHPELKSRVQEAALDFTSRTERPFLIYSYLSDLALRDKAFDQALELYRTMSQRSLNPEEIVGEGCRRILTLAPGHMEAQAVLGVFYASRDTFDQALEILRPYFDRGGEKKPDVTRAMFMSLCQTDQIDDAAEWLERVLTHDPADGAALLTMGDGCERNGRLAESVEYLKRARRLDDREAGIYQRIQELENRIRENRYFELIELLEYNAQDEALNLEMGNMYLGRGEYLKAVKHFQIAARRPEWVNLCAAKQALCMARKFLFDLADEQMERINLTNPSEPFIHEIKGLLYAIGTVYQSQNEQEKALSVFKRIFRIDAGFRDIAQKMEKLSGGGGGGNRNKKNIR